MNHPIDLNHQYYVENPKILKELQDLKFTIDCHSIVSITDISGKIIYVNDKFTKISGYSKAELMGQDHRIINSKTHDKIFMKNLWDTIKSGQVWQGEICNRNKKGELYWVYTTIAPFCAPDGKLEKYVSIRTDVTYKSLAIQREEELLSELKKSNAELTEFAYIASHDLKAPLRGISTLVKWISVDNANCLNEEGQMHLKLLNKRVERLFGVIDGILHYSRIGKEKSEFIEINLNQLLDDVLDSLTIPPHIKIIRKNNFPTIQCEKNRMRQIFQNLISNAIKYNDKNEGLIEIGANSDNAENPIFSIKDNGMGIDAKYFDKIFQIFQTLQNKDSSDSSGIGLAIVKKTVEYFGGKIWLESEVGKGTTFFFTIPNMMLKKNQ